MKDPRLCNVLMSRKQIVLWHVLHSIVFYKHVGSKKDHSFPIYNQHNKCGGCGALLFTFFAFAYNRQNSVALFSSHLQQV